MSKNNAGSGNQYVFSQVPSVNIPRCRLRRPFRHKTAMNAGYVIPFYCDEVIPGDTHTLDLSAFARMTTQVVPTMDNLYMDFQFFFVPYRLLWSHWEHMHGQQDEPGDSIDYTVPYITCTNGVAERSLADYLGFPLGVKWGNHDVNVFPFRAYNLIWNEWFRDENLQNRAYQDNSDSNADVTQYFPLPRNKRKDYFTSALPWPQKGATVELPLGVSAPVQVYGNGMAMGLVGLYEDGSQKGFGLTSGLFAGGSNPMLSGNTQAFNQPVASQSIPSGTGRFNMNIQSPVGLVNNPVYSGIIGTADLSSATPASINDLREAFQVQRLLERDARGGTRYRELLKSHYGVISPDARLQVPELLGTASMMCNIQQIAQSSATQEGTTAQGNLSAIGTFSGVKPHVFSKSFTEWGLIMGMVSIRSDLSYQQGIDRIWSKSSRYDYYYPVLAHLGEQAILNKELFAQDSSVVDGHGKAVNDLAFGYQERWSEYKYGRSLITGDLRSTASESLDVWHLAQDFGNLPTLSSDFIVENPPLSRLLAVEDTPAFIFDSYCNVTSVRPMPLYDIPGLIDHF